MMGNWFLRAAVLFGLAGMGLGIQMGVVHDFTLSPVHAHVNLVGWATMFLAGLFYRTTPSADGRLAVIHFALATSGVLALCTGIAGNVTGREWGVPVAIAGSFLTIGAMALFAGIVFVYTGRGSQAANPGTANAGGSAMPRR